VIAWNIDPSIILGIAGLGVAYVLLPAKAGLCPRRGQVVAFISGLAALALALISPLDDLSDHYLFTAHMLQHLLLLLVVPLLLLHGLPDGVFVAMRRIWVARWIIWKLAPPLPAFLISVVALWVWHTPSIFEAALHDETLHAVEHLCFLGSATLFWWPIARPATYPWPLPDLFQLVYLFGETLSSTLLAALITFASGVLYPTYLEGGPYALVRETLGLTPLADQQVGGLLMWVVCSAWYIAAAAITFFRWFDHPDSDEVTAPPLPARGKGAVS
jgi:putative membrane protein